MRGLEPPISALDMLRSGNARKHLIRLENVVKGEARKHNKIADEEAKRSDLTD